MKNETTAAIAEITVKDMEDGRFWISGNMKMNVEHGSQEVFEGILVHGDPHDKIMWDEYVQVIPSQGPTEEQHMRAGQAYDLIKTYREKGWAYHQIIELVRKRTMLPTSQISLIYNRARADMEDAKLLDSVDALVLQEQQRAAEDL